ncbi:hypothetical protein P152DRAFT_394601 [Eremomyces bilateralis CBS 781.70]|uniref:Uncharacterized protein n=1 Tax=Eremomyces bilateralis CBS 781.70 TaxID=1392243 RepID=A0A6G1G767_9PEZI|nr:uncharacterized protein P152DRAFT_394601 [Eremomyces bilateralis CBS 781.70]KAF1813781.1 hypothetical protein P152DRAFT_394601 [Eremomyces bilateralis CBS 781.70]
MSTKVRPLHRFAAAVGKCSKESSTYGTCITANYKNVQKNMCLDEFLRLKNCYLVSLR